MSSFGRKSPSIGSRLSVYSHVSSVGTTRSTRALSGRGGTSLKSTKVPWWKKPLVKTAYFTDLTKGSWYFCFYTIFLAIWTVITSLFDVYFLFEATPGTNHTGFYIFSFDFVYVGNPHVRNLLIMSGLFSTIFGLALLVTSCILLDALRQEKERGFEGWLWTMAFFTPWKIIAWAFASIVNDWIFAYHYIMFLVWLLFNVLDCGAVVCMYSLFLELSGITELEDMTKLKMQTMSSRAGSIYGSRPTSPHSRATGPPSSQFGLPSSGAPSSHYGQTGTLQSTQSQDPYGYIPPRRQDHFQTQIQ